MSSDRWKIALLEQQLTAARAEIERLTQDTEKQRCLIDGQRALIAQLHAALTNILPWHDSHPAEPTDNRVIKLCREAIDAHDKMMGEG